MRPLLLPLVLFAAPAAAQPIFDCAEASHEAEVAICESPSLRALDRALADRFESAVAVTRTLGAGAAEAEAKLRAYQRGWMFGRDECRKAADVAACVTLAYHRRIAQLVTRYLLEVPTAITTWSCAGNSEIVAYLFDTDPPYARLEYGDRVDTGLLTPTASGSRYEASLGTWLWIKGDEATASMQLGGEGAVVACTLSDRRDGA